MSSTISTSGFGPGQPSRTSIVVAALRAFGFREPDPGVRNPDWLAERLLGPAELQLITEHPVAGALLGDYAKGRRNREVAGMSNLLLIRTRFIDEHMQRALANGAAQIVVLGAGFDTRAYRYADLLKDKTVFEVLSHATELADSNYTRFLNSKIVGVPYKFAHLDKGFCQIGDNETVIGKAMSELRSRMSEEKEYRKQFLGPAIQETAQVFDQSLRKAQQQEMEIQREEQRARFRAGRVKSYGIEL